MTILSLKAFLKIYISKIDTMNESYSKRVFSYHIYPRDSIITKDKGFVNIDDNSFGNTHWNFFYLKDNAYSTSHAGSAKKSFSFDSFRGSHDKINLNQLTKQQFIIIIKVKVYILDYAEHIVYPLSIQ